MFAIKSFVDITFRYLRVLRRSPVGARPSSLGMDLRLLNGNSTVKGNMAEPARDNCTPASGDLELDNQLCFALHAATRLVVRRYRFLLEELGLTHPQYLVLLVLWSWDQKNTPAPSVHALGERLDLDSGTITPLLTRLERRQLIRRSIPDHDRRERYIHLTDAGRALRQRALYVPGEVLNTPAVSDSEIDLVRDHVNRFRAALARDSRVPRPVPAMRQVQLAAAPAVEERGATGAPASAERDCTPHDERAGQSREQLKLAIKSALASFEREFNTLRRRRTERPDGSDAEG